VAEAQTQRLNELAADIGRLRRRYPGDHIAERAAGHVEWLVLMLEPTAAALAAATAPGDEGAVAEAIRLIDARHRKLQHLLGLETP
jgi:hypothetical protein